MPCLRLLSLRNPPNPNGRTLSESALCLIPKVIHFIEFIYFYRYLVKVIRPGFISRIDQMNNKEKILLVDAQIAIDFHFGSIKWKLPLFTDNPFFHINKLEDYVGKIKFPLPPHRKPVYDLIFLTKGKSGRYKGMKKYEFTKNQFFFLPAYQITSHEYISKNAKGYYLHFNTEIFAQSSLHHELEKFPFLNFIADPVVTIKSTSVESVLHIFRRLAEIYPNCNKSNYQLIAYYILCLLEEVRSSSNTVPAIAKNASSQIVQHFQDMLSQQIYQKHSVTDFADMLHITPNHLNKCVKKITGKSSQGLLNEMLIFEAKSLLKYSPLQIAEIAHKLGNLSPSNFTRFFKSQTGMSPKEYLNSAD